MEKSITNNLVESRKRAVLELAAYRSILDRFKDSGEWVYQAVFPMVRWTNNDGKDRFEVEHFASARIKKIDDMLSKYALS